MVASESVTLSSSATDTTRVTTSAGIAARVSCTLPGPVSRTAPSGDSGCLKNTMSASLRTFPLPATWKTSRSTEPVTAPVTASSNTGELSGTVAPRAREVTRSGSHG